MRRTSAVFRLAFLAGGALLWTTGHAMSQTKPDSPKVVQLSPPAQTGKMSVEEALSRRRSVREFTRQELTAREVSQLLWAAQGITHEGHKRAAPSAGALYPLEVYVADAGGFYHYEPAGHRLVKLSERDLRAGIRRAALDQESITQAPAVFVIAAVYERTAHKYGVARASRYVHMEAGHAAENLLLEAVAQGLGGVTVGAFNDQALQSALELPEDCQPLYLIPVGHPR